MLVPPLCGREGHLGGERVNKGILRVVSRFDDHGYSATAGAGPG